MASLSKIIRAGLDSAVDTTSKSEDKLLVTTDSGRLFADYNGARVEIRDIIKDTEANILATLAPIDKIYFATDTHLFYYYDATDGWVSSNVDLSSYVTLTGTQALTNKTYNGYTLGAACAYGVSNSSSASALSSSDTNLATVRDIYYGTPSINGSKSYTSSTTIYAPTSAGTANYVLISSGTGAPTWTAQSNITAGKATADGDGNEITTTYAPIASPELTGTPTAPTAAAGTNTTQIATTAFVTTAVASAVTAGIDGIDMSSYVTLTAEQAITNKTYEGYTLGDACAYSVLNNTTATAAATGTALITSNTLYYALPSINGAKTYTSNSTYYAPTSVGTANYVLISSGTGAPTWTAQSNITAGKATADANGNTISTYYAPLASPALTGTPTAPTATAGTSTTQIATTAFVTTAVSNAVDGIDMSEYVTLTGTEALTNKTYNGYTLGAACAYSVTNVTTATAAATGTGLITRNVLYYALPSINGSKTYTSSSTFYAPTSAGTSGYVLISSGTGAPTWTAQSNITAGKATADGNGNTISSYYAPIASPTLTGTPAAPTATAGTSTTQIATTAFVTTAVSNAIAGVTQFSVDVVTSLPTTGETGVIYLVSDTHEESTDVYDEYIWVEADAAFEKIGNTDIDLSSYVTLTGSQALTNKTYNGYTLGAACAYSVTNVTTATAAATGTTLITRNTLYYALPSINGSKSYTSSSTFYAPTSAGTSGYVLTSSGSGAPTWTAASSLTSATPTALSATLATTTTAYVVGLSSTATTTPIYDSGVYLGATAGSLYATTFYGALSGNATTASSATKLTTARTIQTNLASTSTASFNGTANITPGVTGTLGIANGGTGTTTGHIAITAGTDTTSTASPAHGGTFTAIDSITKDTYGHVTAVNTKTITLPADNNTDTKVTNTLATTSKAYVTGTTSSTTNTGTQVFDTGVYLGATAGSFYATTVNDYTLGDACSYSVLNNTTATAAATGTSLITSNTLYYALPSINNAKTYTSSSTFYAPTAGGTAKYFLTGNGTTAAPIWTSYTNAQRYLGIGYGTCSTANGTVAKTVTLSNYTLVTGGLMSVTFTYDVDASATLNVNSTGAKAIYALGAAITADTITAGSTALFVYTGTYWYLLACDNGLGNYYQSADEA